MPNRLLTAALAAAAVAAGGAGAHADPAPLPAGVAIPVALLHDVSSKDAQAGQTFQFETVSDVRAGAVDVPAGTLGDGVVVQARSAAWARGAQLQLAPRDLRLPSGALTPVALPAASDAQLAKDTRSHWFPFPVPIGPVPFVGTIVNPAKNVTIPAGTRFTVVTR